MAWDSFGNWVDDEFSNPNDLTRPGDGQNASDYFKNGTNRSGMDSSDDALSQLYSLAQSNPEYMETYLQLLAERENTMNAQAWYEKMSGSQYQRAVADLRKAGLNPALALTALSGAGSGSVQPAGSWSTSPYSNKMQKEANKVAKEKVGVQALAGISTAIIALLALLA